MPNSDSTTEPNIGSQWHRWEPHIHAPGTILNDQFKGADSFNNYLSAIESSVPPIRALGVTDYYSTDTYEKVLEAKKSGRLPGVHLIYPNIEMRLDVATVRGGWVNVHLIVSPEDPNYLIELKRFLERLTFKAHADSYSCKNDDLVRLGHRSDSNITHPIAALEQGSIQFKVSFNQLKQIYVESKWAQENILIAVAGSERDGTSGVREGADKTLREEIEKFAQVIFASSPQQRGFWLGKGGLPESEMHRRYGGLKPCLHGSDAHELGKVGVPDRDRFSWIKGDPDFDTLRQACIDPAERSWIGPDEPVAAPSSRVIASVHLVGASWAQTPNLRLNPGLVAIIGARGSGKTALADILALACDAIPATPSDNSFLVRARDLLTHASVELRWKHGELAQRSLNDLDPHSPESEPRARYLSQQFVEELCSAHQVTDSLMREIERVIFNSHPLTERNGAINFAELLEANVSRFRLIRELEEDALAGISDQIGTDLEKRTSVDSLNKQIADKKRTITGYIKDRKTLITKGSEARAERLANLATAMETVRSYLRFFHMQEQALIGLQDEVGNWRTHKAPDTLRQAKERYKASQLKPEEWNPFLLKYAGDVDQTILDQLSKVQELSKSWKGIAPAPLIDPNAAYIAVDAELLKQPLALLEAEIARIERLINVDIDTASKFAGLSKRIDQENVTLQTLEEKLKDCAGATGRLVNLLSQREVSYGHVFETIQQEQRILIQLYKPLMERLEKAGGTLNKLSFSVKREVNIDVWADAGEALLDLRQRGSFKGKGTLRELANESLRRPWEVGDAATVGDAMAKFRADNQAELLDKSIVPKDSPEYRAWSKRLAKWLYGTDHIFVQYSIDYDGVDIRKLSPGTRGIVLLLLYLALDDDDDRPLIIDQPEENLDPKSIFDELVPLFIEAKKKRQVIMVTHNANLVVNTDADQIIIAEAGPHPQGELPPITYVSGGLENAAIRKAVCEILEGGERAFQERARRLRVQLAR